MKLQAWTPEELSALHNEVIQAASRAAADGSVWIADAAASAGKSTSRGVMNAPGAQPTAVGLSTAASSPIGVGSLSFRWTARRLIGGAIAAAIILLPIAGVVWHASNMQQATAPAAE